MIIPGFSDYDITEAGVVTKVSTGKVLRKRTSCLKGFYEYVMVSLVDDTGNRRLHNVLKLLALAYLDKPTEHCMARAKDGNNTNTVLSNVEWVPYSENTMKAWARGQMADRQPRKSSVTEEFIELLYDTMLLIGEPATMAALSRELDEPYSTVRYSMYALIKRGKARKLEEGFEAIQ